MSRLREALLLLLLAGLALPAQARAQSSWGISGGLVSSNFYGDDVPDDAFDSRLGFNAGAFLTLGLTDIIGFTPGAYYVQKGVDGAVDEGGARIDLAYLEVPLLLQVGVTEAERPVGLAVFAGPALAFNVGCDTTLGTGGIPLAGDCDDDIKSFDLGAMFGATVRFGGSGNMFFLANGGIELGLTNVFDVTDGNEPDAKNTTFFIDVGVGWTLGR